MSVVSGAPAGKIAEAGIGYVGSVADNYNSWDLVGMMTTEEAERTGLGGQFETYMIDVAMFRRQL